MKKLVNKLNVDAATPTYPRGRIRDNPGNNTGTNVDRAVYGDMHQVMEMLISMGQLVLNDLDENAVNGFQSAVAFQNLCKVMFDIYHQVGQSLQPPYQNGWQTSTWINPTDGLRFTYDPKTNRVFFSGACERGTENNVLVAFTLPSNYWPNVPKALPILMRNNGIFYPGVMKIATNGDVTFLCNAGNGTTLAVYIVDGVSFNIF